MDNLTVGPELPGPGATNEGKNAAWRDFFRWMGRFPGGEIPLTPTTSEALPSEMAILADQWGPHSADALTVLSGLESDATGHAGTADGHRAAAAGHVAPAEAARDAAQAARDLAQEYIDDTQTPALSLPPGGVLRASTEGWTT